MVHSIEKKKISATQILREIDLSLTIFGNRKTIQPRQFLWEIYGTVHLQTFIGLSFDFEEFHPY